MVLQKHYNESNKNVIDDLWELHNNRLKEEYWNYSKPYLGYE